MGGLASGPSTRTPPTTPTRSDCSVSPTAPHVSSAWHCSRLSSRHAYTSPSCLCAARCSEPARTPCARSTSTQPTHSAAWASTSAARCQLACRSAARPCPIPHTHSHPHQLSELNVLEEDELDALLAGIQLCGEQPPGGLGQPALQHAPPAPDQARGGLQPRPASASWQRCSGWPGTPALFSTQAPHAA